MSFLKAWKRVQQFREDTEDVALSAITTGQNVADDFWENFILVCNNQEGLAELLGVSTTKVATWPQVIQDKLKKSKNIEPDTKINNKVISTGNNEELS